jgi:hypothetical protein
MPAELCAALIVAQKAPVDMMMYSTSDIFSKDNALFTMDDHITPHRYASSNVIRSFSKLYRLGNVPEMTDDFRKELYALAAYGENEAEILLSSRKYEGTVDLLLSGADFSSCSITKNVGGGERGAGTVLRSKPITLSTNKITLNVCPNEVYLVSLKKK